MKTTMAVLLLVASSALAQGQFDRHIYHVTPDQGPVSGGTTITIEGEFNFEGLGDPCDGPMVWIGGKAATRISQSETQLVVRTPAYTAGIFDIYVNACGAPATLKNAFTYTDDGEHWERVLLPIDLGHDTPAAHGSIWRTELAGFAEFEGRITGHPEVVCSQPGGSCDGYTMLGAFQPEIDTDSHVPGRMVYLNTFSPGAVFNLRVVDISRTSQTLGTELPVVREDNAFGPFGTIAIPNVPAGANYRAKLRVYRVDVGQPATVNVFVSGGGSSSAFRPLTTSTEPLTNGFLLYPGYAELDLDQLPEIAGSDRLNITLNVPEGRFWAFVAVTNNDTQQITTVTP